MPRAVGKNDRVQTERIRMAETTTTTRRTAPRDQEAGAVNSVRRIDIVMPVYNDWDSFCQLAHGLDTAVSDWGHSVRILAVDDGSLDEGNGLVTDLRDLEHIEEIRVHRLVSNLGHQRAIAVGLSEVCRENSSDAVIVMDSDGEDRPEDVRALRDAFMQDPHRIVVAQRARRSEGPLFRLFYRIYRLAFVVLTGRNIDFGNFMLIPGKFIEPVTHSGWIWNHLASGIVRMRFPIRAVPTERGTRYAGESKMNPVSLIVHGFSAMSVFSDTVFVRVLLVSLVLSVGTAVGILMVVLIRLLTEMAIPGWATNAVGLLFVIFLQALLLSAGAAVLLLATRSQQTVVPALDSERHVRSRTTVFSR
ncbi:MAG: glycosyltransferase [Gemmatimonadales bacterium]|nr:MAG: glycosyltransferase [Gemmatimonadales bacterium]